jgi:SAM-dependent methyltransferase
VDERLQREKDFHDKRFADGIGAREQDKYYVAVAPARSYLDEEIAQCAQQGGVGLELGCSTGENLEKLLRRHTFKAFGIDISPFAVDVASKRLRGFTPEPTVEVMDAHRLTYSDKSIDFCFAIGVLHHLRVQEAIEELDRVLKQSGTLLLFEPLGTNPIIQAYRSLTPRARSSDEMPLKRAHLVRIRKAFPSAKFRFYGLLSIPCVYFRRWGWLQQRLLSVASWVDRAIFSIPGAWRLAWVVVVVAKRY